MGRVAALFLAFVTACSDQSSAPSKPTAPAPTTPTPPVAQPGPLAGSLVVSNPVVRGTGAALQSVVYVSLPSGQVNGPEDIVVSNLRTNASIRPAIIAGGFDPIAIPAVVNDIIDVAGAIAPQVGRTHSLATVAAGRPLRVIRIDPVNTAEAVSVNAAVAVVFGEPLDPAQLFGRIRLRHIGEDVPATLTLDSTGTRATLRPLAQLAPGEPYLVDIAPDITAVTGAKLVASTAASFTTAPTGDGAVAVQVIGEWDATTWRFTDIDFPNGAIWDDPVVGWGPNAYYRIHLVVTPSDSGPPGSVDWKTTMTWQLGGPAGLANIAGSATVGAGWWLGRTTASPWLEQTVSCQYGYVCPFQDYHDFKRDGDMLTVTRRATLWYIDGINPQWRAREVLTLRRATP
jgi:hypothetical protein